MKNKKWDWLGFLRLGALAILAFLLLPLFVLLSGIVMMIIPLLLFVVWVGSMAIFPLWFTAVGERWWKYQELKWVPEKSYWMKGLIASMIIVALALVFQV